MRIGIITVCENWVNYGAFLQMYSLYKVLEEMGHSPFCVLQTYRNRELIRQCRDYRKRYVIRKTDKYYILRKIWRLYRILENYIIQTIKFIRYRKNCKGINFINIKNMHTCDCVIMGSDEIWNVNNPSVDSPFYWGMDVKIKKIAFAVCAGESTINDFVEKQYPIVAMKSIANFAARDKLTKTLIEKISGKECLDVLDPTFLVTKSELEIEPCPISQPFILIYAWEVSTIQKKYIIDYAKKNGLLVVCAMGCRKYDFADINIDISPLAFANTVKRAECVFAGTFHGCVFSIIESKRAIFSVKNNKVRDLLEKFQLSNRIFTDDLSFEEFESILTKEFPEKYSQKLIYENRMKSLHFLEETLEKDADM